MNDKIRPTIIDKVAVGLTTLLIGSSFIGRAETKDLGLRLEQEINSTCQEFVGTQQDALQVSQIEAKVNDEFFNPFEIEQPINFENLPSTYLILKNEPVEYPDLDFIGRYYPASAPYIPLVEAAIEEHKDIFHLDPVLVLGLMYAESSFNPDAVSGAGAAGLMQIIPETAKGLGMKIYEGNLDIYEELKKEIGKRKKSSESLFSAIIGEKYTEIVERAREYNQSRGRVNDLAKEYKETLLEHKDEDERFYPKEVTFKGTKYVAILARLTMGTPKLADPRKTLTSYNFRGEAAAVDWDLPTADEPITLSNRALDFFRRMQPWVLIPVKDYLKEKN